MLHRGVTGSSILAERLRLQPHTPAATDPTREEEEEEEFYELGLVQQTTFSF